MSITLTPEQEISLNALLAKGGFVSIEDAARRLIDNGIAALSLDEHDDMNWANPYLAEADADVKRGSVISKEKHEARTDARLATMT